MMKSGNNSALLGRFLNEELPKNRAKISNCIDAVIVGDDDIHGIGLENYFLVVSRDMARIKNITNDGAKGAIEEVVLPTSEFLELIRAGN